MTYRENRLSYGRQLYYILCIVAVVVILLFSFFSPGGYFDLRKARAELQEQSKRIEELKRINQERTRSIEALRWDKDAIEREARKRGYGRENEIVQQLPDEPAP